MARTTMTMQVSEADRAALQHWGRSPTRRHNLSQRARLVLALAEGQRVADVAHALQVSQAVVRRWRRRDVAGGLAGLADRPRSGQPRKTPEETTRRVLALSLERLPAEASPWSVRLMAASAGTTTWPVRQIWQEAGLRPHRDKTCKRSRDPHLAEQVIDVVGLDMAPPDQALVLSVDAKPQSQALERPQRGLPPAAGKTATRTHDAQRHGTLALYAALDVASGQVLGEVTERHRAHACLHLLTRLDQYGPQDLAFHLLVDHSSTHKTPQVRAWLAAHTRLTLHCTPTSASWLHAVEGWFAQLERRALARGSCTAMTALREELHRFISAHNPYAAKPFVWTRSAEAILASVAEARRVLGY